MPFNSSDSSYLLGLTGSITIRPPSSRTSTTSSTSSCVAFITEVGSLTAALFPHFFTVTLTLLKTSLNQWPYYARLQSMYQQCRYEKDFLGAVISQSLCPVNSSRANQLEHTE